MTRATLRRETFQECQPLFGFFFGVTRSICSTRAQHSLRHQRFRWCRKWHQSHLPYLSFDFHYMLTVLPNGGIGIAVAAGESPCPRVRHHYFEVVPARR